MASQAEILFNIRMQDQSSSVMAQMRVNLSGIGSSAAAASGQLNTLRGALGAAAVAFGAFRASSELLRGTVGVFAQYELGMANIQKVTRMSDQQMRDFGVSFDALARKMPIPIAELQKIGYNAGSLGVTGTANILAITEAVAKLGTTTNLTGENATKSIVRILNVTGEAATEAGRFASELVRLENVTPATATDITNVATQIALGTSQFHIGSTAVLGFAAAMSGMGIRAEISGSTMQRSFQAIDRAVNGNLPTALTNLSLIMKETKEQMAADWNSGGDAKVKMVENLIQTLGTLSHGDFYTALDSLKLGQQNVGKSLDPLVANFPKLVAAMRLARDEAMKNTAQDREFNIFQQTQKSLLQELANSWELFGKDIGAVTSGQVKQGLQDLRKLVDGLDSSFKALPEQVQMILASFTSFGGIAITTGLAIGGVTVAMRALTAAMIANPFTAAAAVILGIAGAWYEYNEAIRPSQDLTEQEAASLAKIQGSAQEAKVALVQLTQAEREHLEAAAELNYDKQAAALDKLTSSLHADALGVSVFALAFDTELGAAMRHLGQEFDKGGESTAQLRQKLEDLKNTHPDWQKDIDGVIQMTLDYDHLAAGVDGAKDAIDRLKGSLSELDPHILGQQVQKLAPTTPTMSADAFVPPSGLSDGKKATGGNHAQEVADFLKETNQKIEANDRMIAAYAKGAAAVKQQEDAERQLAEVEAVTKRGIDLKIPSINALAASYAASLKAIDAAKQSEAKNEYTKTIDDEIKKMGEENAALAKGKAYYEAYKKARTIEDHSEEIYKRCIALGMEKDAAMGVVAAYQKMALANEQAQLQFEQYNKRQQESAELAKTFTDDILKDVDALTEQHKRIRDVGMEFAKQMFDMTTKALLLKPLENALSGMFNSQATPGSSAAPAAGGPLSGGPMAWIMKQFGLGGSTTGSNGGGKASSDPTVQALTANGGVGKSNDLLSQILKTLNGSNLSSADGSGGIAIAGLNPNGGTNAMGSNTDPFGMTRTSGPGVNWANSGWAGPQGQSGGYGGSNFWTPNPNGNTNLNANSSDSSTGTSLGGSDGNGFMGALGHAGAAGITGAAGDHNNPLGGMASGLVNSLGGSLGKYAGSQLSSLFSSSTVSLPAMNLSTGLADSTATMSLDSATGAISTDAAASSGGILSSLGDMIASIFHGGGEVGHGTSFRHVSASTFNNAPRYHAGLGNDEFAAILQRGERVLTAKQNTAVQNQMDSFTNDATAKITSAMGGTTNHYWNITTPDANSFMRTQDQIMGRAAAATQRVKQRNG